MKRFRIVTLITLMALLFGLVGGVSADDGEIEPNTFSSFSFSPSSVYYGDNTTISVDYDTASSGEVYDNVLCFYYDDGGWDSAWPVGGDGTRSGTNSYILQSTGTSATECDSPANYGRSRVAEYRDIGVSFGVSLFGETVTFDFSVPSGSPPNTGTYSFDLVQEEGSVCWGGGCTLSDGASADLTLNSLPSTVYVSNTSGCGGNSPCYTGGNALQEAFDDIQSPGTVNIYGTWSQGGSNSGILNNTDNKSVTLTGFNSPRIENGGGTCSGAMIDNQGSGTLTVQGLTIDGTCGDGSRSAGILNSGSGQTNVMDNANTIRDFTGSGNGVEVSNGTMVVAGNTFVNNYAAMEASGSGTLYAFANNVTSNTGADAASFAGSGSYNVKCNYWGGATIDTGFGTDYEERLGSPVNNYVENDGTSTLTLGAASLDTSGSGNQVLINLGRDTDNPPFNNGTVSGLGALVSDFYAACSSRGGSAVGALTLTGDSVSPGADGFRLYEIQAVADCSPSDNVDCWDYAGDTTPDPSEPANCNTAGCTVTDEDPSEGHFVVGNEVDPTAVTFTAISASSNVWLPVALVGGVSMLALGALVVLRKRA